MADFTWNGWQASPVYPVGLIWIKTCIIWDSYDSGFQVDFCEGVLMNRRKLLGVGLASVVMPLSMRVANASAGKDNSEDMVTMLFVQSAHGAELARCRST